MKTAVSIPDDVFEGAEQMARRTSKSRSQIFSEALREYLARHAPDDVTRAMNQALEQIDEEGDPLVAAAAQAVLERTEW